MQLFKKIIHKSIVTLFVVFAICSGITSFADNMNMQSATVLPKPRTLAPFQLTDMQNQAYTNQNLTGHWTMMFFGFTHCTTICPTTMAALKDVYAKINNDQQMMPQVVFVSIDPARDNEKRIQQFVTAYNPNFMGVTGSEKQLNELAHEVGVVYMKMAHQADPKNYQIDHSGTIMLFSPKGDLYAVFSMPHDANAIAKDYEMIVKQYG